MDLDDIVAYGIIVLGVFALVVVIALLMGFPTMWLVNYLFTPKFLLTVFGISKFTFWKAFWLNVFSGIIFGRSYSNSNTK